LTAAGYLSTVIFVLFPYDEDSKEAATRKNTKTPEGAVTGARAGAVIGGVR
jgi:hypothetical protein